MLRLNLGAGALPIEGFQNLDRKTGQEVFPLSAYADGTVDEVRASHILEHFSFREQVDVLREWVRVLKPGGVLKLAVPDFKVIAQKYLNPAEKWNTEGFVMGGHADPNDYHKSLWDAQKLRQALEAVGLTDVKPWTSEIADCASLPVSLNLQGSKPSSAAAAPQSALPVVPASKTEQMKVSAVISAPRLGFMDNFFCAFYLNDMGIRLYRVGGAFWGQCLEKGMMQAIDDGAGILFTMDYDTVFSVEDVRKLCELIATHPEVDAIAPVQACRHRPTPLVVIKDANGVNRNRIDRAELAADLIPADSAHFGLTVFRVSALKKLAHPWFHSVPDRSGCWGDMKIDDDIYFWKKFKMSGLNLCLTPRVVIGHAELMIQWPDQNLEATIFQYPGDYWKNGKPAGVWQ